MNELPVSPADIAVIGILLLSALLAFMRGLVREVLSIGGWVGAALVALYTFPHARPFLREFISITLLADALTVIGIFIATLVVLSLLSHQISRHVRGSALSAVDRSLGFVFGIARGAVLVCLSYLLITWVWPPPEQPDWLRDARTLPAVATGAEMLRGLVPDATRDRAAVEAAAARERAERAAAEEALRRLATPRPDAGKNDAPAIDTGYKDRERTDLERLIENSN